MDLEDRIMHSNIDANATHIYNHICSSMLSFVSSTEIFVASTRIDGNSCTFRFHDPVLLSIAVEFHC